MSKRVGVLALAMLLCIAPGASYRIWSDASGANRIEAEFVMLAKNMVTLKRKRDGELIQIPLASLRAADRKFAEQAQDKSMASQVATARKRGKPRQTLPALIMVTYPAVRQELGLLDEQGNSMPQDDQVQALADEWRNNPTMDYVLNRGRDKLKPDELIELALASADETAPKLDRILNASQRKQLAAVQKRSVFPVVTRASEARYLQLPAVRQELALTSEQAGSLAKLSQGRLVARSDADASGFLQVQYLDESELALQVGQILSEPQRRRLEQIRLQCEPSVHVARRKDLASRLKLDAGQKKSLEVLNAEFTRQALLAYLDGGRDPRTPSPDDVAGKLKHESNGLMIRLLQEKQHSTWDILVGESFDLWGSQSPFDPQSGSTRRNRFPGEE